LHELLKKCGGSVWESNPPFDPLRTESPALKAGEVTGPLSPPLWSITGEEKGLRVAASSERLMRVPTAV